MLAMEYCARAVIRYLNGDMDLFKSYTNKAIRKISFRRAGNSRKG